MNREIIWYGGMSLYFTIMAAAETVAGEVVVASLLAAGGVVLLAVTERKWIDDASR